MSDDPSKPLPEQQPPIAQPWYRRLMRSRANSWIDLTRPYIGFWMMFTAGLMTVAAARGSLEWTLPIVYAGMVQLLSLAAGMINDAHDIEIDNRTRLYRPIPMRGVTVRSALIAAAFPTGLGAAIGFANDWQVGVIGMAMLMASALYSYAWRGSVMGVASFALIGVLMPAGAIQLTDASISTAHLLWLIPVGGLSGAATYMIYKLPFYEFDDFDGYRSVLHWLGIDTAIAMSWAVLAAALALAAASLNVSGGDLLWLLGPLLYLILAGLFCFAALMNRISYIRLVMQRWLIVPFIPLTMICWLAAAAGA